MNGHIILDGGPFSGETYPEIPSTMMVVPGRTDGFYRDTRDRVNGVRLFRWRPLATIWASRYVAGGNSNGTWFYGPGDFYEDEA